jgi:hypothetical protein
MRRKNLITGLDTTRGVLFYLLTMENVMQKYKILFYVMILVTLVVGVGAFSLGKNAAKSDYQKQLKSKQQNAYLRGCQYPLQQALPNSQMFDQFKDEYAIAISQCNTQSQTIDF